jgi:N-acyl-D-amino-acid deacylase
MRKKIRDDLADILVKNYTAEGLNRIQIANYTADTTIEGKGIEDILKMRGMEVNPTNGAELIMQLEMKRNEVIYHGMSEDDVQRIMKDPVTMHGSDGHITELNVGVPHPRNYGTFPRILGLYVREKGLLTLEEAIRKMTSMPAGRFQIRDGGLIQNGKRADIVIFDPETIIDKATFLKPHQYPVGIDYVFVNGEIVVDHGTITGKRPGKIIYGPGRGRK